jgi:hypothetical protein
MTNPVIVSELYAWVTDDDGIVASSVPGIGATPFVFATERTARLMEQFAQVVADETGRTIRLARFERVELLTTLTPEGKH